MKMSSSVIVQKTDTMVDRKGNTWSLKWKLLNNYSSSPNELWPREDKGDREGIPNTHPIP